MKGLTITQLGGDHPAPAEVAMPFTPPALDHTATPSSGAGRAGTLCAHCSARDELLPDDDFVPEDLHYPTDPEFPDGPVVLTEQEWLDAELDEILGRNRSSRVDEFEWQEWDGVDQDDAEREMLRRDAPAWVFLPPGGDLAGELETTRPQAMSPIALIELMKATTRQSGWVEAIKVEAMASFYRQRQAEHAVSPRPAQCDSKGRPIDPERSWYGEIALALGLSEETVARRVATALRLTGPLRATHTALKCGALTWGKALAIAEATADLSDQAAQAVEAHVMKRAASQTHKNLLQSLRRQVAKHTAAKDADDHRAAVAERTCKIIPLANGMAGLWIVHTADKIQQIWVTIQAMAALAKRPTPDAATTDNITTTAPHPPTTNHTPGTPDTATRSRESAAENTSSTTPTNIDTTPLHNAKPTAAPADANPAAAPEDAKPVAAPEDAKPVARPGDADPGPGAADKCTATGPDSAGGPVNDARTAEHRRADTTAEPAKDARTAEQRRADTTAEPVKDVRTAEQRRADVVADLFQHMLHNGLDWLGRRLPDQHRRRPHIEVVIPASTLLGMDDDPAELTGYGPHPGRYGPPDRQRRHLAPAAHRPGQRGRAGSLHHPPRPWCAGDRNPPRPAPGVRLARLQPLIPRLRPRPHHPVRPDRDHQPDRARAVLRISPRRQGHPCLGLDQHQPPGWLHHADRPHRAPLHHRPTRPRAYRSATRCRRP